MKAESKNPEFKEKAYIPVAMVPLLEGSDKVAEIGMYFGEKPEEARRIITLPQAQAAREIGRLEASFNGPKPRTKTNAPKPTGGEKGLAPGGKKPEEMSHAEYKAWRLGGGGKT